MKDMIENLKYRVDPYIDLMLPILLKRATDTNLFINQEARKVLLSICYKCSESKLFHSLSVFGQSRSPAVRGRIIKCFEALVRRMEYKKLKSVDLASFISLASEYFNDSSSEVRAKTKSCLRTLDMVMSRREFLKVLKNNLNDSDF